MLREAQRPGESFGGGRGLQEEAQTRTQGQDTWPGQGRNIPVPKDIKLTQFGGKLTLVYVSSSMLVGATRQGQEQAQAEVSKRRSIMSPTCSTRYLMYFSGFLVKGTLLYLSRHRGWWGGPAPPLPSSSSV